MKFLWSVSFEVLAFPFAFVLAFASEGIHTEHINLHRCSRQGRRVKAEGLLCFRVVQNDLLDLAEGGVVVHVKANVLLQGS